MFRIGQKVVCVRNDNVEHWLELNKVYTVEGVETYIGGVKLTEIGPHVDAEEYHWYFINNRFRPLVERKTDISVFKALLNPVTHDA